MRNLALVSLAAFLGTAAIFTIPKDSLAINAPQTLLSQQLAQQNSPPKPKPTQSPSSPRMQ
ncbi:hypothetical protein [Anabaena azotica]|uniref:hypothetical protein n=1 Tax=Anabaena azotica TaxID=197653 RepID=UPI0039A51250